MKKYFKIIITIFFSIIILPLTGQNNVIKVKNPSFESIPTAGDNNYFNLPYWDDCGMVHFPNETSPDIHSSNSDFFEVRHPALDGETYLGLVTRENYESWELITQKLDEPMLEGHCYEFSLFIAKADVYLSALSGLSNSDRTSRNFNNPIKLRIWGCSSFCSKDQMLAETELINHTDWKKYLFTFKPNRNYQYFILEAFYKTPNLVPYNGNILLDKASDIVEIPCPDKDILAKAEVVLPQKETIASVKDVQPKQNTKNNSKISASNEPVKINKNIPRQDKTQTTVASNDSQKTKIIKELDKDKIRIGQTIKIENLFFKADSANINPDSYEVLDEIFNFLYVNTDVIIEIGGHTNGIPNEVYCSKLSADRAKKVAEYLYNKGISKDRVKIRGYGKSKPLASDKTLEGRRKNQRVEIKILHVGN